jgi:hypothetical protein
MFDRTQYTSYANNTKWSELRHAMVSLYPRAPRFRVKTFSWHGEEQWDGEWYYHFRSDYEWKNMECVDLKPRTSADAVQLDEIAEICRRIGFEIEQYKDFIRVVGYRKSATI